MQIILNGIIIGGIYALIALGFNLIYSSVRFYHMLYGVLAISGVYFLREFQMLGMPFPLSALCGSLLVGLIGMASWQWLYRPMAVGKKASDLVMLVLSFGALIILQNTIALIWQNNTHSISVAETIKEGYQFFGLSITFNQVVILATTVVVVILLELFLGRTKWGMAIRAIGDNPELTTTLGLKTNQIVLIVFFIGSFMSSISASLIALEIGVRPTYGLMLVLKAIIASIIGGIGSMRGAMFGGLILGIVENIGIYFWGASWQEVTAFTLLTVFLLIRPQGLFQKFQLAK
jgi:branched-chain amino acid transport system permease protein